MYNDILQHYGVKGMRWGVRKTKRVATKDARNMSLLKQMKRENNGKIPWNSKLGYNRLKKNITKRIQNVPGYKKEYNKVMRENGPEVAAGRLRTIESIASGGTMWGGPIVGAVAAIRADRKK